MSASLTSIRDTVASAEHVEDPERPADAAVLVERDRKLIAAPEDAGAVRCDRRPVVAGGLEGLHPGGAGPDGGRRDLLEDAVGRGRAGVEEVPGVSTALLVETVEQSAVLGRRDDDLEEVLVRAAAVVGGVLRAGAGECQR